jgi:ABC-type transport system substrate-binding protein
MRPISLMIRRLVFLLVAGVLIGGVNTPVGSQPGAPELQVAFSVGPSMLEPRLYHDRNGNFVPVLAKSWRKVNETTLEFKLQENVRFTNGEPFTSESVKYTIESIIAPNSQFVGNRASLLDIERVETPLPDSRPVPCCSPSRSGHWA